MPRTCAKRNLARETPFSPLTTVYQIIKGQGPKSIELWRIVGNLLGRRAGKLWRTKDLAFFGGVSVRMKRGTGGNSVRIRGYATDGTAARSGKWRGPCPTDDGDERPQLGRPRATLRSVAGRLPAARRPFAGRPPPIPQSDENPILTFGEPRRSKGRGRSLSAEAPLGGREAPPLHPAAQAGLQPTSVRTSSVVIRLDGLPSWRLNQDMTWGG